MDRAEHLAWTKERALEYLPEDPTNALASFFSDMSKHDDLVDHVGLGLGHTLMAAGMLSSAADIQDHIEGYN